MFVLFLHSETRNSSGDNHKIRKMKNHFEDATVVASESKNVVVETTSINNLNSNDMVEEKTIATEVAPEIVANATTENVNAAENAASINPNPVNMEKKNEEVAKTTKIAIIDGDEREILMAHTKYAMELPKDKKELCKKLDPSKMLSVIYHLTKPKLFWQEGYDLYDENGNIIKEGTPNVLVHVQTSEDY